jgi:hypothetical protein
MIGTPDQALQALRDKAADAARVPAARIELLPSTILAMLDEISGGNMAISGLQAKLAQRDAAWRHAQDALAELNRRLDDTLGQLNKAQDERDAQSRAANLAFNYAQQRLYVLDRTIRQQLKLMGLRGGAYNKALRRWQEALGAAAE